MTRPVHPALPWIGVVAAPLAWVVQLVAGYAFQEAGCAPVSGSPVVDVDTESWIAGISALAVVAALVGIAASLVTLHAATTHDEADPRGRIAFMGDVGVLVSVIFLAVIVLGAIALPALDACQPG